MTLNPQEKSVLLSLDGRGFYVLHYTGIPEANLTRIHFELVDPNTGEGASTEALVDPRLMPALNKFNSNPSGDQAFLIWIDTVKGEVSWQLRKIDPSKVQ